MRIRTSLLALSLSLSLAACGGDDDDHDHDHNEEEVITTVTLTFAPEGGGASVTAAFDDPDGDGGAAPTVDPIELAAGGYTMTVKFENRLEDPAENITEEVEDESDQHQLFFRGTATDGPLTHAYADADENGLPIGLESTIDAVAGDGELTVTLCHMPPVNDEPVKVAGLNDEFAGDCTALGGETDAQVDFDVAVE
jgi:hypothetical protein